MPTLTREKLLKAKIELPTETVDVPEFGGKFTIRGMTGKDQSAFHKSIRAKGGDKVDEDTFGAKLVVHCLVDDKGERLLMDADWELVYGWPTAIYNRVSAAAMRVNGLVAGN
jgi:hypothetical protein